MNKKISQITSNNNPLKTTYEYNTHENKKSKPYC